MTFVLYLEPGVYHQYTFAGVSILFQYQYLLPHRPADLKLSPAVPISLIYGEKELNMTTLKAVSLSAMEIGSTDNSSGGNDIASQISRLAKQITKVTQQLKEVASGDGTAEEKQKQQELLESQLAMLQAQMEALQRQQAEESAPKQGPVQQAVEEGVNKPSAEHQIDIYI